MGKIAQTYALTNEQVFFAFVRHLGVIVITGTRDETHMAHDMASLQLTLSLDDMRSIERLLFNQTQTEVQSHPSEHGHQAPDPEVSLDECAAIGDHETRGGDSDTRGEAQVGGGLEAAVTVEVEEGGKQQEAHKGKITRCGKVTAGAAGSERPEGPEGLKDAEGARQTERAGGLHESGAEEDPGPTWSHLLSAFKYPRASIVYSWPGQAEGADASVVVPSAVAGTRGTQGTENGISRAAEDVDVASDDLSAQLRTALTNANDLCPTCTSSPFTFHVG